ncbi:MAG: GGDEF domain-containing protein [Gammaproteobacteria bacterium]|nr:GGDEF domain-containing protein [Gammaproteobacteria bacterium]MCW8993746.1 GGDEF domain-containing protein [Gammaproteobacteria bacterium]
MQFRIKRYFLLSSLSAVLLVLVLSVVWYAYFTKQLLLNQETRANAYMTQVLGKLVWEEAGEFITRGHARSRTEMQQAPEVGPLDEIMAELLDGNGILKVKIYNSQGFVIYSTQHSQIGQEKTDNPGFQSAMRGEPLSFLNHRNQFHSFEQTVSDRSLLSTYIPFYHPETRQVVGVFELYSDVTGMVRRIDKNRYLILAVALACFLLISAGLFLLMRRGERIIRQQYAELVNANGTIHRLAYLDSLTRLPNRNSFDDSLRREIAQERREGGGFALFYMDLDGFKAINDQYGHAVGDHVLHEVANRLRTNIRESDQVFRMGGDEFTALLRRVESEEVASGIASKIIAVISEPICYRDRCLNVSISLGIALYPFHATDMESLIDLSDNAMYQAKQAGSNCFRFARSGVEKSELV